MKQWTILLVEDHDDTRHVYRIMLEYTGFRVLEAADGEEGIRRAREEAPDLVLMDISIPLIDGWKATEVLKGDERTRHIPVIALTAHAMASDRLRAKEVGCDGYLTKPLEPLRLVKEMRRWLEVQEP
jgi:two-component system, cell cycle response regulator DivK